MLPERKGRDGEKKFLEAVQKCQKPFTLYKLTQEYKEVSKSTARRHLSKFIDKYYACVWIEEGDNLRRQWYTLTKKGEEYIEARLEQIDLDEGTDTMD